jgi:hypothetical protein
METSAKLETQLDTKTSAADLGAPLDSVSRARTPHDEHMTPSA